VRRLLPDTAMLEVGQVYDDLVLARPDDRAWVAVGMVTSVDGAASRDGATAALGGEADQHAFRALRAACDVILVGAGTVRAEDYGPPTGTAARRARRGARGLAAVPALALVSGSLDLDPAARVFSHPDHRPLVFTHGRASEAAARALAPVAEVVRCGDAEVDLLEVLYQLHRRGLGRVLCEGGPALNGALFALDAVDELFLTVDSRVVGGDAGRIVRSPAELAPAPRLRLVELFVHDDELLLHYRRSREERVDQDGHPGMDA
jgi:riboflavin-specific deaminase-like protein